MLGSLALQAQQKQQRVGDFIESTSYNLDKIGVERSQQYYPVGGAFVCENGVNRFTRALYGGGGARGPGANHRPAPRSAAWGCGCGCICSGPRHTPGGVC